MATIIKKDKRLVARLRAGLLAWYDAHGRDLPWRKGTPEPYRVWLSEVMLQQTTTAHAAPYYAKFLGLWPAVADLAAAPEEHIMAEWAGLGYYSRARNLIKCARTVAGEYNGRFPADEAELLKLPGFGPYTAAAVAAIAFGRPANVIDGNIERVMTRLYAIETPLPEGRVEVRQAAAQWISDERPGDWPQALMDLAATVCRVRTPSCLLCPLRDGCDAFKRGEVERFPVKAAKAVKPKRQGAVFLIVAEEGFIAERRQDRGLLGGMLGLPHTEWQAEAAAESAVKQKFNLNFERRGAYEHVFTHFALTQEVWLARASSEQVGHLLRAHNGWQVLPLVEQKALPTVFRKALKFL
jgi:A/G-specific adenine glycosylase